MYTGFNVVTTRPASEAPRKVTMYSGQFGITIARTSPLLAPRRRRLFAKALARLLASVKVSFDPEAPSTKAVSLLNSVTRLQHMDGKDIGGTVTYPWMTVIEFIAN